MRQAWPPNANQSPTSDGDFAELLRGRGVDFVSYQDWQRLDQWEVEQGRSQDRVRDKLSTVADMMRVVGELRG